MMTIDHAKWRWRFHFIWNEPDYKSSLENADWLSVYLCVYFARLFALIAAMLMFSRRTLSDHI